MQRTLIWHTLPRPLFFFLFYLVPEPRAVPGVRDEIDTGPKARPFLLRASITWLLFKGMTLVGRAGWRGVKEEEGSLTLLYLHRFQFIRSKHFQDQKALILSVWTAGNNEGGVGDLQPPSVSSNKLLSRCKNWGLFKYFWISKKILWSCNDLTAQTHKWVPFYQELKDKKRKISWQNVCTQHASTVWVVINGTNLWSPSAVHACIYSQGHFMMKRPKQQM